VPVCVGLSNAVFVNGNDAEVADLILGLGSLDSVPLDEENEQH